MQQHVYLTTTGIETTAVGFYFTLVQAAFKDDPHVPFVHVLHSLGSPYWAIFTVIVGLFVMMVGLLNLHRRLLDSIALMLLGAIWMIYSVAFIAQSMDFGHFDVVSIFCMYNFFFVIIEAWGS